MKFIISVLGLCGIAATGVYWLPKIRTETWDKTRVSSTLTSPKIASAASEDEVKEQMQNKISEYDIRRDLRKLQTVPDTPASLEAAFRNHKTDVCEQLPEGEPMGFRDYTLALTPRDQHREASMLFPATRREFLTIGLTMISTDEKALPTLSRSLITSYLNEHYLSLQARISKDPVNSEWMLNYRPIAAVGRFGGQAYTQAWEEAIASTVQDICGLGILETKDPEDKSQTAVLLFRFTWLDEATNRSMYRHELGFLHAVPRANVRDGEDPFEFHLITTSNERKTWNYFEPQGSSIPRSRTSCGIVGTIRFDEYMSDGLRPKRAATRKIDTRPIKSYDIETIKSYLASNQMDGGWNANLKRVLKAIVKSEIPSS